MPKLVQFELSEDDFNRLDIEYSDKSKNQHVARFGVEIVKLYLKSKGYTDIKIEEAKVDIQGIINNKVEKFEVKSTRLEDITFYNLKVSSPKDFKALMEDKMEIIRVCKVGQRIVDLHFLKYGIDFILVEEPRWRLAKIKK